MSRTRNIQRNQQKMKHTQQIENQTKIKREIDEEKSVSHHHDTDPEVKRNNWILFGFIGFMCIVWGILYWIFIV